MSEVFPNIKKAAKEAFVKPLLSKQALRNIANFKTTSMLFNQRVLEASNKAGGNAELFLKKVMLDLLRKIIRRMPVDTGRARAAWAPFMKQEGVYVDLKGNPIAVEEGLKAGTFQIIKGNKPSILVVNGVEYCVYLEYGSSKQAPGGMVRISMRELGEELKGMF